MTKVLQRRFVIASMAAISVLLVSSLIGLLCWLAMLMVRMVL